MTDIEIDNSIHVCTSETYPLDDENTETKKFLADYRLTESQLRSHIRHLIKWGFDENMIKEAFNEAWNNTEEALQHLLDRSTLASIKITVINMNNYSNNSNFDLQNINNSSNSLILNDSDSFKMNLNPNLNPQAREFNPNFLVN